jgi:hypothetical protein
MAISAKKAMFEKRAQATMLTRSGWRRYEIEALGNLRHGPAGARHAGRLGDEAEGHRGRTP